MRKSKLEEAFAVVTEIVKPAGIVWGQAKWGHMRWGDDSFSNNYNFLKGRIRELDKWAKKSDKGSFVDANIGATALAEKCILVSADRNLLLAFAERGGTGWNVDHAPNGFHGVPKNS